MNQAFILKKPIITEKATSALSRNEYTFGVAKEASKGQIRQAVEKFFKVNVVGVKTITMRGKTRRLLRQRKEIEKKDWKKAIVELKAGQKIDIFNVAEEKPEEVSKKKK